MDEAGGRLMLNTIGEYNRGALFPLVGYPSMLVSYGQFCVNLLAVKRILSICKFGSSAFIVVGSVPCHVWIENLLVRRFLQTPAGILTSRKNRSSSSISR